MKQSNNNSRGIFSATVKNLRSRNGRCILYLELNSFDDNTSIKLDIHDSLCETSGLSKLSTSFLSKVFSNMPRTIFVSNRNGYWEIKNESQLLSDIVSKSI